MAAHVHDGIDGRQATVNGMLVGFLVLAKEFRLALAIPMRQHIHPYQAVLGPSPPCHVPPLSLA